MKRLKAIYFCLKFGVLPFWMYEKECHYKGMTYFNHLVLNIKYALVWITFRETSEDIQFEAETNNN